MYRYYAEPIITLHKQLALLGMLVVLAQFALLRQQIKQNKKFTKED